MQDLLPLREREQFEIAKSIVPLIKGEEGDNLIIIDEHPRTFDALRHVTCELQSVTRDIVVHYVDAKDAPDILSSLVLDEPMVLVIRNADRLDKPHRLALLDNKAIFLLTKNLAWIDSLPRAVKSRFNVLEFSKYDKGEKTLLKG